MSKTGEITLLEAGQIRITNRRAWVGTDSFEISSIITVRVTKEGSLFGCLVVSMISVGLLVGLFAIVADTISETDYSGYLLTAAFLCISSAVVIALTAKPTYTLQISGPFGNIDVLQSNDKAHLERIARVLNDAILYAAKRRREKLQLETRA